MSIFNSYFFVSRSNIATAIVAVGAALVSTPNHAMECLVSEVSPGEATVQDAFIAYYGRPADPEGLSFWSQQLTEAGGNLQSIIDGFGNSEEFDTRFGSLADEELVNGIYQQLFNRDADPEGLTFYLGELTSGRRNLQTIALDVLFGAQNADIEILANKRTVSSDYLVRSSQLDVGLVDADLAAFLSQVTADAASAQDACSAIEIALNDVGAGANASFEVRIVNQTLGQPFSPIAALAHDANTGAFSVGQPASAGLELLAEAGDNSQFLADSGAASMVSGTAPVGPGGSDTLTLELNGNDVGAMQLTVMTMLVNTNDAITGINGANLGSMAVGDSVTYSTIAYDAGTEANSERAETIPGPAGGGEGINAARDDIRDQVTMHGGVVTIDDGLDSSGLLQLHRFDNPVARITVTRTQ